MPRTPHVKNSPDRTAKVAVKFRSDPKILNGITDFRRMLRGIRDGKLILSQSEVRDVPQEQYVRLSDDELAELDRQRGSVPRAIYLRSVIARLPGPLRDMRDL
jgi:hypothetical protein